MLDKIKKFIKKHLEIIKPYEYPDKSAINIMIEDYGWHPMEIDTLYGNRRRLGIEIGKLKREIWNVFYEWVK